MEKWAKYLPNLLIVNLLAAGSLKCDLHSLSLSLYFPFLFELGLLLTPKCLVSFGGQLIIQLLR